jgi:pentapeptide MXKDX repeat protein
MKKRIQGSGLDESSILTDARKILAPQIEDRSRRSFLLRGLTLGGVAMLSGCNLTDNESVDTALSSMSRFNDRVQGWLFNPNAMAPTYPESMITRPFPFNAFYGIEEAPTVDEESYRLEVTGLVADKRSWRLEELRAMAQTDQITRHICVEGWSDRPLGRRALQRFPQARGRRHRRQIRRLQMRRRLLHQHRHGHGAACTNPADADLRRRGIATRIRLPDEAAHAHQAWLQEPQTHPGDFRQQHLQRWLLGRPGLQLVWWQLTGAQPFPLYTPHASRSFIMKKLTTVVLSMCLAVGAASMFAADTMSNDSMSKDSMSKDAMSKDTMKKDAMTKDSMSKDAMSKDTMKKDSMSKDAMKKMPCPRTA